MACGFDVRLHDRAIVLKSTATETTRASGGMADALASGASVLRDVGVQVPLRPRKIGRDLQQGRGLSRAVGGGGRGVEKQLRGGAARGSLCEM